MVRKRFTTDEATNQNKIIDSNTTVDCDDTVKHSVVNGYKKIAILIFLFAAVVLFRIHIFDVVSVEGTSMSDSFLQNDILFVKKYGADNITRYDVVISKVGNQKVIKRVIGLPNDTVYISDGITYINNERIDERYDFFTADAGIASESYTLGENEYFLMGDNRSVSADSRKYGCVKLSDIKGIVILRIYPFDKIETINCSEIEIRR